MLPPAALRVRTVRTATVRPLAPGNPQPLEVFDHRLDKLRAAPLRIQIFVTQDQIPVALGGSRGSNPERARVSKMQQPGRRGRQPPTIPLRGTQHGSHQPRANRRGLAMNSEAAYSICRTLLGRSLCDLDDAWTIRGLMATTPPFGQTHSTAGISFANSWSRSSHKIPRWCVWGRTFNG